MFWWVLLVVGVSNFQMYAVDVTSKDMVAQLYQYVLLYISKYAYKSTVKKVCEKKTDTTKLLVVITVAPCHIPHFLAPNKKLYSIKSEIRATKLQTLDFTQSLGLAFSVFFDPLRYFKSYFILSPLT